MLTSRITESLLSSHFNALADCVGRSESHPLSIEAPVGRNRGRLQNPAKALLVAIIIRLCRGEAGLRKQEIKLMALETGTHISDLNAANPVSTDGLAQADDHLRLIKSTVKATLLTTARNNLVTAAVPLRRRHH